MQPAEPRLDTKRQELAKEHARLMRRLSFAELAIVGILFVELIFGGTSVKLSYFLAFSQPWASALYFIILVICLGVIMMPLTYYQGFILPRRYGLSSQNFGAWLVDRAKASALGFLLGLAVVILLYWTASQTSGGYGPAYRYF